MKIVKFLASATYVKMKYMFSKNVCLNMMYDDILNILNIVNKDFVTF
jgi:hypothetical protein